MKDFKLCFSEHKSLSYQQQSISGDESSLWNFSLDTNKMAHANTDTFAHTNTDTHKQHNAYLKADSWRDRGPGT